MAMAMPMLRISRHPHQASQLATWPACLPASQSCPETDSRRPCGAVSWLRFIINAKLCAGIRWIWLLQFALNAADGGRSSSSRRGEAAAVGIKNELSVTGGCRCRCRDDDGDGDGNVIFAKSFRLFWDCLRQSAVRPVPCTPARTRPGPASLSSAVQAVQSVCHSSSSSLSLSLSQSTGQLRTLHLNLKHFILLLPTKLQREREREEQSCAGGSWRYTTKVSASASASID